MKITKYPQSCLMVETQGKKILIDPGVLLYEDSFLDSWRQADAIFVTHRHSDHCHAAVLAQITDTPIYATAEVRDAYPEIKISVVKKGDTIEIGSVKIEVVKAIHGYNPWLKDGNEIFENVGYIVDDGEHRLYATSDTICFNNDYRADILAVPVTAHGLTMSAFEAALMANEIGAKLVLPVHMDNPKFPTDLEYMKNNFERFEMNYKVLEIGESWKEEL